MQCHAVSGRSNELFSDFKMHVAGIPQIAPKFGAGTGNVPFRDHRGELASNGNQDYGLYDVTEEDRDAYKFRTSPLRNLAVQPTFFHNGAFTSLSDALRYHLRTMEAARHYDPRQAGAAADLTRNTGPVTLSEGEFSDLLAFLRDGLLDPRALPENLAPVIPASVPSGLSLQVFEATPTTP